MIDTPGSGQPRTILHADLDAFYASVEQRDNPELGGKAVAVGMGIVLAASYEARRFGVKTPLSENIARRHCPHLIVVPPRMEAYAEASRAVFDIFSDTSPMVEAMSIDEAFIDVTGLRRLVGPADEIAAELRRRVRDEVGLPLSVGVASTKFLAKVASAVGKPDGLLVVEPGRELEFLHPLPVEALWGVGPKTAERLHQGGLMKVADVAQVDLESLVTMIGKGAANHIHALANNSDPRRVEVGRRNRSIGSQRSMPRGGIDRPKAEEILLAVCDGVSNRLRTSRQLGRTVTLRLRFGDFSSATRSHTLTDPTDSTKLIHTVAHRLLTTAWPMLEERGCTRVGVAVSNLCPDDAVQLSLPFGRGRRGTVDSEPGHDDRGELDRAIDQARRRFGYQSLSRARLAGGRGRGPTGLVAGHPYHQGHPLTDPPKSESPSESPSGSQALAGAESVS